MDGWMDGWIGQAGRQADRLKQMTQKKIIELREKQLSLFGKFSY